MGHQLANGDGGVAIGTVGKAGAQILVEARSSRQRVLGGVVDNLSVDVLVGAVHREPRTVGGAGEMATQAPVAALGLKFAGRGRHGWIAVC